MQRDPNTPTTRIKLMMLERGYSTNAELGAACLLSSKTVCNTVRGWNTSRLTRQKITNALAPSTPFWADVPVDGGAVANMPTEEDQS